MRKKIIFLAFLLSLSTAFLFLALLMVNPNEQPLVIVVLPVLFTWISLYLFLRLLFLVVKHREGRLLRVSLFGVSSMLVILLVLSGIGQLKAADILLVLSLTALATFYFYRTWS